MSCSRARTLPLPERCIYIHLWAGLLVVAMAGFRLARPLLPERTVRVGNALEQIIAVLVVALALTIDWLPLGPAVGLTANIIFVGVMVGAVVVSLRAFMWLYVLLLQLLLARKLLFLTVPAVLVAVGLSVWLGFPRIFGWAISEEPEQRGRLATMLFDRVEDVAEVDAVEAAPARIDQALESGELELPDGVSFRFAGSYESQLRSEARLMVLIPVALAFVFVILYLQFHRVLVTVMIYSGVLVAVAGGFLLL